MDNDTEILHSENTETSQHDESKPTSQPINNEPQDSYSPMERYYKNLEIRKN